MKKLLRFIFVALVFATTGLFAQAAVDTAATAAKPHKISKAEKKTAKKHKKHKKKNAQ
jgi:Ni/Co efflux regulator RcnB